MPKTVSARRYAQALFHLAIEREELELWLDDLSVLANSLRTRELAEFLDAPQVPLTQKVNLIRATLGASVAPLALNLLCLLASRGVAHLVPGIVDQYQRLLDAHRGIERAEVVSAVPLAEEQRRQVRDLLQALAGREVRLSSRVEPQILGGLVARVGDRVIDGSTRAKLREMRRELVERRS
jgi:F-type H+-transporting ATPase subunit delta